MYEMLDTYSTTDYEYDLCETEWIDAPAETVTRDEAEFEARQLEADSQGVPR